MVGTAGTGEMDATLDDAPDVNAGATPAALKEGGHGVGETVVIDDLRTL